MWGRRHLLAVVLHQACLSAAAESAFSLGTPAALAAPDAGAGGAVAPAADAAPRAGAAYAPLTAEGAASHASLLDASRQRVSSFKSDARRRRFFIEPPRSREGSKL